MNLLTLVLGSERFQNPTCTASSCRAVLTTLASHVDERGGGVSCWPSVALLAEETCLAAATVKRALEALVSGGWITIERKCQGALRRGNRYSLCRQKLESSYAAQQAKRAAHHADENDSHRAHSGTRTELMASPVQSSLDVHRAHGEPCTELMVSPAVETPIETTKETPSPLRVVSIETRSSSKPDDDRCVRRFVLPSWVDQQAWAEYEAMRRRIKAPLTDGSRERNLRELDRLRTQGHSPAAVLLQSVDKCWKGVFALKHHVSAATQPQRRYREEDYATA